MRGKRQRKGKEKKKTMEVALGSYFFLPRLCFSEGKDRSGYTLLLLLCSDLFARSQFQLKKISDRCQFLGCLIGELSTCRTAGLLLHVLLYVGQFQRRRVSHMREKCCGIQRKHRGFDSGHVMEQDEASYAVSALCANAESRLGEVLKNTGGDE